MNKITYTLLSAAFLLFLAGCGPKKISPMLRSELAPAMSDSTVTVDVVGISKGQLGQWRSVMANDYFAPGHALRGSASTVTLNFGPGKPTTQTISDKNSIWARWEKTADYLVIIADMPGPVGNTQKVQIIPLDSERWNDAPKSISISISTNGVTYRPQPLPPKQ